MADSMGRQNARRHAAKSIVARGGITTAHRTFPQAPGRRHAEAYWWRRAAVAEA